LTDIAYGVERARYGFTVVLPKCLSRTVSNYSGVPLVQIPADKVKWFLLEAIHVISVVT